MAPPILTLRDIELTFGGTPLFEGAELTVGEGDRVCLVGRNGSGKSTLLKIAAGQIAFDGGERFVQPGTTMRYLPQEPDLSGFATTLAYVEAGLGPNDEPYTAQHAAQYQIDKVGLTGTEDPATLSGGETRRCALARVLAPEPDILLLDEPTNHLDLPAIEWLEGTLKSLRSAIVMVSHDRRFLEHLSRATVWIYNGESHRLDQGFGQFENWRDGMLEKAETERHKLKRKIHAETEWMHKGVTARRKRNQGRLRALYDLREKRQNERGPTGNVIMSASQSNASSKVVIDAHTVEKAYGNVPIVSEFSLRVLRGEKIGFVGPNGAGKTTLLNLITGALKPDSGKVKLGGNLEMVTLDQARESLDPKTSLADVLTGGGSDMVSVGGAQRHVVSYLKDFLFDPAQAGTPVGALSGGERGRVMLARALARPSNLLILDEPTNDLDLETLDLLQEMLSDYSGTVLLVSHDRDFLDRIVTSTIAWEGPGRWVQYAGGYSDMVAQKGGKFETKTPKAPGAKSNTKNQTPINKPIIRKKLTFKDKHALETLPGRIAELEKLIIALQGQLADPTLFAKNPDGFNTAAAALEQSAAALAAAEEDWLALEMRREEIEGA